MARPIEQQIQTLSAEIGVRCLSDVRPDARLPDGKLQLQRTAHRRLVDKQLQHAIIASVSGHPDFGELNVGRCEIGDRCEQDRAPETENDAVNLKDGPALSENFGAREIE